MQSTAFDSCLLYKKDLQFYFFQLTFQLKTTIPHQYGPRDIIEQGEPIDALLEFGIGRAKYACDVVEALLREIKGYSNRGL